MSWGDPIVGGTSLRIPAEQSPNFSLAGKTGWAIMIDGSAYFFNVTATGIITATSFAGTDFTIDSAGIFFYNGAPAAGNLLISIANTAGTDPYTNVYPEGMQISTGGKSVVLGLTGGSPLIYFVSGAPNLTNGAALQDIVLGAGLGQYDFLQILSAENTTNNDLVLQGFAGSSQDGTQLATINQQYKDSAGVFHTWYVFDKNGPKFPLGLSVNGELTQVFTTDTVPMLSQSNTTVASNNGFIMQVHFSAGSIAFKCQLSGDAHSRFILSANGMMQWGNGTAGVDTTLERVAAGVLAALQNFLIGGSSALGDNGVGELQIANATTVPTTNPTGGFDLYAHQGVPSVRDPGGQLLGMVRAYSAAASGTITNPAGIVAVTGATVNVVITGSNATVQITTTFDMSATSATTMVGHLHWNAVDQSAQAIFVSSATGQRACVSQRYTITGVTAGTYPAALFASSSGTGSINATHTGMNILVIDQ